MNQQKSPLTETQTRTLLNHLQRVARFMDSDINILGIRVGVDAIIGLVPAIGDMLGGLISVYIIYRARAFNFDNAVYSKMLVNVLYDVFIGSVPVIGDLFDLFYKANEKNVRIIESELGIHSV